MLHRDIVVIGASAGGIVALQRLASRLPADFPASVLIVVHLARESAGMVPEILARAGPLPASNARHGEALLHGHIYVAPPDRHLLLIEPGKIHIGHGPKENRFRPAVDPLFRSAAVTYGARNIGIILSGALDDGTAGLCAIKNAGGLAIVQDPAEAQVPSMPVSAFRHVAVDYVLTMEKMAALLPELVREVPRTSAAGRGSVPDNIQIEIEVASDQERHPGILKLGSPSIFTCPECHGSLVKVRDSVPARFRCHTGHAFTAAALEEELREQGEMSAWSTVRTLQEHAMLLQKLMEGSGLTSDEIAGLRTRAEDALARASLVRTAIRKTGNEPTD
jgi:two-component system chemotaxis response regulator CheB